MNNLENNIFPLPGYPKGSDIMVLQVDYIESKKIETENGRTEYTKDFLNIIFKDNKTGKKHHHIIYEPTYTYYILKNEYQIDHVMEFMDMDKLQPITCKYRELIKSIAISTGNFDLFKSNIKQGQYRLNKMFKLHPRVFGCDLDICNYVRILFSEFYTNSPKNITTIFYDIETDDKDSAYESTKDPGKNPINAISLFDRQTKTSYSFILRNPKIPKIQEIENKLNSKNKNDLINEVCEFVYQNIGSYEKSEKYGIKPLNLITRFYDLEIDLIKDFFDTIHNINPDFAIAYNASFDFINLQNRIVELGYDPLEIICENEFEEKYVFYYVDEKNKNDYAERGDYCAVAAYTVYLDQMVIYASRRKGRSAIENNKLDTVGNVECGVRKVSYSHITTDFKQFCYLDFKLFWIYNIFDTIVQACIEAETDDVNFVLSMVLEMSTPYKKVFRQTIYLSTKFYEFAKKNGYIMGNNTNVLNPPPDISIPGAFVANPNKMSDLNKQSINDYYIYKFKNCIDFDFAALYPNLIMQFNFSKSTQIGMLEIENPLYHDLKYLQTSSGGTFLENLASKNYIEFGHRWLNLPNVEEQFKLIEEYFNNYRTPSFLIKNNSESLPMDSKKIVMNFYDKNKQPIKIKNRMPEWLKTKTDEIRKQIAITDNSYEEMEIMEYLSQINKEEGEEEIDE